MKKFAAVTFAAVAALASTSALAFFDSKNKWEEPECWYNPQDCNPYDEWDPRYWMEEMEQMWNDDNYGGGYGMPYGGPMGGPMGGYGMPYGRPMMPYGAPMQPPAAMPQAPAQGAPMAPPYGMPYMPRMPYQAPRPAAPAPAPAQ